MAVLVERDHIGVFGKINSGKSSIINLLTQQSTSIVDATPGTTADTKVALQEIHGLGPVRLYDTAGVDEGGRLGSKKKARAYADLKECDLILLVIDPAAASFNPEAELLAAAREQDKQVGIIYNLFHTDDAVRIGTVEQQLSLARFYPKLSIVATDPACRHPLLDFIGRHYEPKNTPQVLLPFLAPHEYYILVIPMDVETPPGRFLRPQAMVEEYITRHWSYPVSFRLDLAKARNPVTREEEKQRFERVVNGLGQVPKAVITDSQAMDVMFPWCPPAIALTTFSIVMIQYMSRGRLGVFARGLEVLPNLMPGDKILIVEACNHSRIGEDIGTVQIPKYLQSRFPGVVLEHNFGREFQENEYLKQYRLVIHCGACMISSQKLQARLRDLDALGVAYTNYGLMLAYMQGEAALRKVLAPWGLD